MRGGSAPVNFAATLRIALLALRVNKMRSALTMLGIIIGVAAVIIMIAVGGGAQARVEEQIRSLGSNIIMVLSGSMTSGGARGGIGSQPTISEDDGYAIGREIEDIQAAAPTLRGSGQVVAATPTGRRPSTASRPTTSKCANGPSSRDAASSRRNERRRQGGADRPDRGEESVRRRQPARSGNPRAQGAADYHRRARPQGPEHDRAGSGRHPADADQHRQQARSGRGAGQVAQRRLDHGQGAQGADMGGADQRMRELLRQRHRLQAGQDDDFFVRNLSEILQAQEASSKVMTLLLAAVASVSLLVGGIGIMNIMLVSVTERTREIGLRMAVGARARDILTQFLVEAVTLSLIGGVIGILLGVGGAMAGGRTRRLAHRIVRQLDRAGRRLCRRGRHILRLLPGAQGLALLPIEALRYE
jgi:putative ABC transport system permease protein